MKEKIESQKRLRFEFIGMMFALAIGQVGLEVGNFYENGLSLLNYPSVATHLTLVIFIIASSWIGWQTSKSKGNGELVLDNFGKSFLILILDLLLVIFYFIIAIGVESQIGGVITPRVDNEIFWSLWIFGTYFIWDILTKLIYIINSDTLQFRFDFMTFLKRGYQSVLCFLLIWFLLKPMQNTNSQSHVVIIDIALFLTFILFRGLKVIDDFKDFTNRRKLILFTGVILPILGIIFSIYLIKYYYV